ncbi:uncharacterized protein LOC133140145 isoform X2 [Conger conger]|uniref:uncharacterized protein LOC133140145 isoform X2 n=1 Tax=Conger conger TaxID=82655 RepID=UPI002A59FEA0|nr:uncharacterized protein LOC133140145 isoform X2 [Conger conger]
MTGQILTVGGLKALLGKVVGMETMLDIFKQAGFVRAQVQPPAVDSGPFDNVHAAQVEADNRKGLNTMTHREFVDHVVHTVERQRKEEKSWKIKQKTFKENYCAAEGAGSQRTKAPPTPEPWSSPMVPRPAVVYNFSGIPHPVAMQGSLYSSLQQGVPEAPTVPQRTQYENCKPAHQWRDVQTTSTGWKIKPAHQWREVQTTSTGWIQETTCYRDYGDSSCYESMC